MTFRRLSILIFFLISGVCGVLVVKFYMENRYADRIFAIASLPKNSPSVAIVFGAGIRENNEPSAVLYDRVWTAVDLYKKGVVKKLLLTGDNRFEDYNEPEVMRTLALKLGVLDTDLILDYAGRRSYDSCYRAIHIFGIKKAVLISQAFHLPRCLYLCDAFGLEAIGIVADHQLYPTIAKIRWMIREVIATLRAWYNVNIQSPKIILGDSESVL